MNNSKLLFFTKIRLHRILALKRDCYGIYSKRLRKKIKELEQDYSCIFIIGPKQVGKTTVFKKLLNENRHFAIIDDKIVWYGKIYDCGQIKK